MKVGAIIFKKSIMKKKKLTSKLTLTKKTISDLSLNEVKGGIRPTVLCTVVDCEMSDLGVCISINKCPVTYFYCN